MRQMPSDVEKLRKRSYRFGRTIAALIAIGLGGVASASAEQVLRIGMTAAAVPVTTGMPTEGLEGFRFGGYPIFESLAMYDLRKTDNPPGLIPWLATEWSTDPADRKKWTFKLRQGVKFQDGTDFNADAVVWNLARLFDPKSPQFDQAASPQATTSVFLMDKWQKVDDSTVAIWSKDVATYFPEMLTGVLFVSPTQWDKTGKNWAAFGEHPIGTGAFKVTKVDQTSIEMAKNPNYWNKDRAAKLDKVILYPMPEATTRLAALRSGQVDWIEVPPPDAIQGLKDAGFQVVTSPFPHIWPYWLKTYGNSPFKDVRVREAFNYAIDRDGLVALLNGTAEPAVGFWKPSDPRFGNPKNKYKYDPQKSRQLLAEAGYPNGGVKIKILTSTSGSGQMLPVPMNELVQQSAKAAGFDVELKVVEVGQLFAMTHIPDNPQLADIDALNSSLTTSDMNWFFKSFYPPNWGHWANPDAVALMEKYRTDFASPDQSATLAKLHEIMVDDAPWAWVVHDRNPRAFSSKVKGYTPAQSWFTDLTTVYMEQ
jgi:ABC-type transport system substrate-binding protein